MATSRNIAATFARLLGFTTFTVKAQSVAGIVATGQTYNMIPVGLDGSTPYTYGQAIVMHSGNCGSGCWGAVDYTGSSGANTLGSQLTNGCGCTVTAGSTYQVGSFGRCDERASSMPPAASRVLAVLSARVSLIRL